MSQSNPTTEKARTLVRAIGREAIVAYLSRRLSGGQQIPSRPSVIRAYALLVGVDSIEILRQISVNLNELSSSRVSAINAWADLVGSGSGERREDAGKCLIALLEDIDAEVRNASASRLISLGIRSAIPRLQELSNSGKLETLVVVALNEMLTRISQWISVPPIPNAPMFLGREHELRALTQAIADSAFVFLIGAGGTGKTSLASVFAGRSSYDIRLWINCRQLAPGSTDSVLRVLTRQVKEALQERENSLERMPFQIHATLQYLTARLANLKVLLVVDEYEALPETDHLIDFLSMLVKQLPNLRCLFVGRTHPPAISTVPMRVIELGGLSDADSIAILAGLGLSADELDLRKVLEMTQGSPLVLRLTADVLKRHDASGIPLLHKSLDDYYASRLSGIDASQRRVLEILAQRDTELFDSQEQDLIELIEDELRIRAVPVLDSLVDKGLLVREGGSYWFFHKTFPEYLRRRTETRDALRLNLHFAQYYRDRGEITLAAKHFFRADMVPEGLKLVSSHLRDIIARGKAQEAVEILTAEAPVDELSPSSGVVFHRLLGDLWISLRAASQAKECFTRMLTIATGLADQEAVDTAHNGLALAESL